MTIDDVLERLDAIVEDFPDTDATCLGVEESMRTNIYFEEARELLNDMKREKILGCLGK